MGLKYNLKTKIYYNKQTKNPQKQETLILFVRIIFNNVSNMYTCGRFMLMYGKNHHNTVK